MAIRDIIRYEGTNDVLIFKHPTVDFNKKTQLTVHENQEAIVVMNGEMKDVYGPGSYELESENIAGIKHIVALFSGGELANHCEVYFVNKLLFANVPWVTTTMDIQDKTIGNYYSFWAEGFFNVKVNNSYDLFSIIGNADYFTTDNLKEHFSSIITSAASEMLSIAMNQEGISYGEINSHLSKLSKKVRDRIEPEFKSIGLSLEEFRFKPISIEKDEEYNKHRGHLGERSGQQIEGYTYDKKRMYDVMEKQAENQGAGGAAASMMSGAGFGYGIGQVYGGMVGNAAGAAFNSQMNNPNFAMSNNNSQAGIVHPHQVEESMNTKNTCSNCKKEIQPEWLCCPWCGQDLVIEKTCPCCGKVLPNVEGIKLCPYCKTKLF